MNILLTHSYFLRFDSKEFRSMMPYPPLGTLYAASILRTAGHSVSIHDTMFEEREDSVRPKIERQRPDLVVIYDDQFNYLTKMCLSRMREAAHAMLGIAKEAGSATAVFSSDASDHLEQYFAHGADFVLLGEAEQTLVELCRHLQKPGGEAPSHVHGLAYVQNGNIVRTAPRTVEQDLDMFPFPAWDLLDANQYRSRWKARHGYWSMNIVTTRGCPFHCNWCAKPIYGQVYHSRSPSNVVEEMVELEARYHPDHLWFADDIFGLTPGWLRTFSDEVSKAGVRIPFKCLSRADLLLKDDCIKFLKSSGCQTVWMGAESGSQKILDAMEKGTTLEQIRRASQLAKHAGIRVGFFLQFGYPGETREEIEQTLRLVRECAPDEIGVSISYPLPGTRFYDRVKSEIGVKENWVESADLEMMFRGTYSPAYYKMLHRFVHKQFRVWRGVRSFGRLIRQPADSPMVHLKNIAAAAYDSLALAPLSRSLKLLESGS